MAKKKPRKRNVPPQRMSLAERKAVPAILSRTASKLVGCSRWPFRLCTINADWQESLVASIVMTRRRPDGGIVVACYYVDLGCLGVKKAIIQVNATQDFVDRLLKMTSMQAEVVNCDPALAVKIIEESVRYAESIGFKPADKDFMAARLLYRGVDPGSCPEPVICGKDGMPYYVNGPDDDVHAILVHLDARFGPDGFIFIEGDPDMAGYDSFDEDYDEDYDDDYDDVYDYDDNDDDDGADDGGKAR